MSRRHPAPERLYVDGREVADAELAMTNAAKRKGLLGRDGLDGGFVLQPCHQVHTFRMRFPLDVAYLDRTGRVLLTRELPPGRLGPLRIRCRSILEAQAGAFEEWGLAAGSVVTWRPVAP